MIDYGCSSITSRYTADFEKDPDETSDFDFNWSPEMNGDSILTSTFVLPDGLTQVSSSNTDSVVTIFVSGGDCGRLYRVTNRITTTLGRTRDKTIYIRIREQ